MSLPAKTPKLPQWIFFLTDAVLLGAAVVIATQSAQPLSRTATLAIVACLIAGAIVALVPLIARYEHQKNETLDDRQRALEALALTVGTSAEQIGIAASGLHTIAEIAQKNLKHAEQLPHRLQEKIAEFNAQLDNAREDDREELEKELADLRASETERLQSASDKIHKAVAELTRLEAAAQKHLAATAEALAKAQTGTATALKDATAAATQSLATAAAEASRAVVAAQAAALAEIEAKLAARTAAAVAAIEAALGKPAAIAGPASVPEPVASPTVETPAVPAEPAEASPKSEIEYQISEPPPAPKRPRKPRREAPVVEPAPVLPEDMIKVVPVAPPTTEPFASQTPAVAEPAAMAEANPKSEIENPKSEESAPAEVMVEIKPVVPPTAAPFASQSPFVEPPAAQPESKSEIPSPGSAAPAAEASPKSFAPARRRSARKPAAEAGAELPLALPSDEFAQAAPDDTSASVSEVVEKVITSDGATRLLVTAYIGIGNRLFVRGEGPGLSWEKGVPLQFVSIGKWRWETAEATAPVACKLYKNDETECTALGTLTLDPGHQQEVSAKF